MKAMQAELNEVMKQALITKAVENQKRKLAIKKLQVILLL